MIPSAFENVKRLSDGQLQGLVEAARKGDMTAVNALNLTSATPVLAEMMRRQQMRDMFQKNMMASQPDSQKQPSVADQILAANDRGIGGLEVPGVMDEDSESYASGGIVAFSRGGEPRADDPIMTNIPAGEAYEVSGGKVPAYERARFSPQERRDYDIAQFRADMDEEIRNLGPRPSAYSEEEAKQDFEQRLAMLRGITDPYTKRLQELIARTRPDVAGETKKTRDQAEIAAFLSMIGKQQPAGSGVGRSLYNTAQSVLGGVEQYNKGISSLKKAEQAHAEAEMEGIKAESARAAGNFKEALLHQENQRKAREAELRFYNQSLRNVERERKTGIESIDRGFIAEIRAAQAAAETARKEEADRRRDKTLIEVAGIRANARGGGGGNTDAETRAAEARATRDYNDRVKDTRVVKRATELVTSDARAKGVTLTPAQVDQAVRRYLLEEARALQGLEPRRAPPGAVTPKPKEAPGGGGGGGYVLDPNTGRYVGK